MELFDTHCHLTDRAFRPDLEEVLARARAAGVVGMVCVGYDLESSRAAVALAEREDDVWAAVGLHPHYAVRAGRDLEAALRSLARHPKVVAVGETGLDFYRDLSPRDVQKAVFLRQIEVALGTGLPLIVHDRDAHDETLQILEEAYGRRDGAGDRRGGRSGVMHCFSGDEAMARSCVELGFSLSFTGTVTLPRASRVRAVAASVPEERLLIETDCPYLAPQSRRGRRNEPAYIGEVAAALAAARGDAPDRLALLTSRNARTLFLRS
jgi:TatD DNase family protein